MIVDKLCERCGKLMVQVQHNRKRCPECAYIVHREQIKQRYIDRKDTMTQCRGKQVKRTNSRLKQDCRRIRLVIRQVCCSYGNRKEAVA